MKITKLKQKYLFISLSSSSSFIIKLKQLGDIWLFNCPEACQHILASKKIKINQISKIIITSNSIRNISGLLGLLSSISLNTKVNKIDVYGPIGLSRYIFFSRKYSQTSFRYKLDIHESREGLLVDSCYYSLYSFINNYYYHEFNYVILFTQKPGQFNSDKANQYKIPYGPLLGFFKFGKNFILPDGYILYGKSFINGYYLGAKVVISPTSMNINSIFIIKNATYVYFL